MLRMPRAKSKLEETFWLQLKIDGLDQEFKRQFPFDMHRRWKADFGCEWARLLVECEGGIWNRGRHTRGKGFENDCEKYNHAVLQGWRVIRLTPKMIKNLEGIEMVKELMKH